MNFYEGKTVVITGAAGFIGSHLIDALLSRGATVIGVDNFITGRRENLAHLSTTDRFTFKQADVISDPATYLPSTPIDLVFHFASPASPPGYQQHPVETYMVNVWGTHNLLTWIKTNSPATRFLFASTSEVYGDPLEHPQKETYFGNVNPNGVRSMYDESKRLGETICGVHTRSFGIDTRIVRIFNTYGPRMDPLDGRSLVEFVTKILRNQEIHMSGDGTQTRSYCYVSDLVTGVLQFMENTALIGETLNLGNPDEISMNDLVSRIEKLTSKKATVTQGQTRPDDPKKRRPDISKATTLLSWKPVVSLDDGLTKTLEYFRLQPT